MCLHVQVVSFQLSRYIALWFGLCNPQEKQVDMEGITRGEHVRRRKRSNAMIFFKRVVKKVLIALSLGILAVSFSLVLEFVTGVPNPIVIMHSDFKECNITAGDTLFIHHRNAAINVGDVVLSNVHGPKRPSFHRVIGVYDNATSAGAWFLTQGDTHVAWPHYTNNNQLWLQHHHIIGRVFWSLPYVGRFVNFGALKERTLFYLVAFRGTVSIFLIYLKTKREARVLRNANMSNPAQQPRD